MTKHEADFIGAMNMCDEISNEAYEKIMNHCEINEDDEDEDDFIFTTIKDYCESVSEMKVSKAVLRRALYCFKTEHKEEYEYLTRKEEE